MTATLYVVQASKIKNRESGGEGLYVLIFPQLYNKTKEVLFSHYCTNSDFAMSDLRYKAREDILNTVFKGIDWHFVLDLDGTKFEKDLNKPINDLSTFIQELAKTDSRFHSISVEFDE